MTPTLILCTKNGGERLRTCLDHIEALDWEGPLELFLVDNGSDDGVSSLMLERFAAASRFDAKVRRVAMPGNSAGRNVAIAEARGDILIFIDDDCYADPGLIREWLHGFADPAVGYGSGMVTQHDKRFSMIGCVEDTHERRLEPTAFIWRGFVQGSNMAFRSTCLAEIGPFDERFGAGLPYAGEDWDMSLRAGRAGWSGVYFPLAKVAHDHRRTEAQALIRRRYYDFGGGMIYAKHTFVSNGLATVKEMVREARRLFREREPRRLWVFAQGYFTYILKLAGGRGSPLSRD